MTLQMSSGLGTLEVFDVINKSHAVRRKQSKIMMKLDANIRDGMETAMVDNPFQMFAREEAIG